MAKETKVYLNLTDGLNEFSKILKSLHDTGDPIGVYKQYKNYSFIRIQSNFCKQNKWEDILNDLDADFLFNLAIGNCCIVLDYGKGGNSRAIYQGVEWIRYCIERIWFERLVSVHFKKMNVTLQMEEEFRLLSDKIINKLKYYKKFLCYDEIELFGVCEEKMEKHNYGDLSDMIKTIRSLEE